MLSQNLKGLCWLTVGSVLLTIGDIIYKFWAKEALVRYYVFGLIVYVMALLCLVESFKTHNMAIASAILVIGNIVTLAFVSWLYFGEPLSTQQIAGVGLAVVAVVLMS